MADVFVSYSRRDKPFVEKLVTNLVQDGREVWVDWQDIPRAADWLNEIDKGIENAATFIFVVSTHSLSSEICNHELEYALRLNKRIVPIIREDIKDATETSVRQTWSDSTWGNVAQQNWTAVSHLNWIFFNDDLEERFTTEYQALVETLDADLEHIKLHTRILVREREWEENVRKPGYLLMGEEILEAEQWLTAADQFNKNPHPTDLHRDYIEKSRSAEDERLENLRRLESRTRQFRTAAAILGVVIIATVIVAIGATLQTMNARQQANDANLQAALADTEVAYANATLSPIPPTLTQSANDIAAANQQVENANATLTPIPPTLTQSANDIGTANAQFALAEQQVVDANATLTPIPATLTQSADNISLANSLVATANSQVQLAGAELTSIPPTLAALDEEIAEAEERVAALALAARAFELGTAAGERLNEGNAELAALLAIRSLRIDYNPAADSALVSANSRLFTTHYIQPDTGWLVQGAISGDGDIVVLGFAEGDVRFWDADTSRIRFSVDDGHDEEVTAAMFIPKTHIAITGDLDGNIIFWDADTGELLEELSLHNGSVLSMDVSPGAERLATGGEDNNVCIVDIDDFEEEYCFDTDGYDGVWGVDFGEDSDTLLATFGVGADLWDLGNNGADFEDFYGDHRLGTYDTAFSPDMEYVLTGSDDESMILWDTDSGEQLLIFEGGTNIITHSFFMPDGEHVVSASVDGTPRIWNIHNGRIVRSFGGHTDAVSNLTITDDGRQLLSVSYDGTARIWNSDLNVFPDVYTGHLDWVTRLAFSEDGRYLASGSNDFTMRIWDTFNNTGVDVYDTDGYMVEGVTFLPDTTSVLFDFEEELSIWDRDEDDIDEFYDLDNWATKIRLTGDNRYMVIMTIDEAISVIEIEEDDEDEVIERGEMVDMDVAIDANIVVWLEQFTDVVLYDLDADEEINRFTYEEGINAVSISPDGQTLMLGDWWGWVGFADASTGDIIVSYHAHTAQVSSLAVSPDGMYGLSASFDEKVILWDMATMQQLRVYNNHTNWVWEAIFTPDSQRVASAGVDRTVQVWQVDLDNLIADTCRRLFRDLTEEERARFGIDDDPTCR